MILTVGVCLLFAAVPAVAQNAADEAAIRAATKQAIDMGNIRTANTILCGVLATFLDFEDEVWKRALHNRFPAKILDINLKAFDIGREAGAASSTAITT